MAISSCKKDKDSGSSSIIAIDSIYFNGKYVANGTSVQNVNLAPVTLKIAFLNAVDPTTFSQDAIVFSNGIDYSYQFINSDKALLVTTTSAPTSWESFNINIKAGTCKAGGKVVAGYTARFTAQLDSTFKFPLVSDTSLLTIVQKQTFKYFWDFAHPQCGMARERNTSGDVVTTGGSGFGVMALIVGMNRGFISRSAGLARFDTILGFLESCDRFHGAWPHWLNGVTGKVVPFSTQDDGADLVETNFMMEGLLTMRQYLDSLISAEDSLIHRITRLYQDVEYDWFTNGQNVLYWHWSPDYGWEGNMQIQGYNETLITYILAESSITHPISATVYSSGYAQNGGIINGNSYYGYVLPLGSPYGGPLFFTQYSYLGLDPRNLSDKYANYWEQNVNQTLINCSYCAANPMHYTGYSLNCWGLTASDNPWGYNAQSPINDLGVITPTAAVSSLPYTPQQSLDAIRFFYYKLGDKLWGPYGFYDSFDPTVGWWANSDLAIDEGPIIDMIENYRTGLLWNLFMTCPEVKSGLIKIGFTY